MTARLRQPPMDPVLTRILADLAPSRLFAAFEGCDALRTSPRSLFNMCLRACVPFALVDGILQANLPSPFCRPLLVPPRPGAGAEMCVSHVAPDAREQTGWDDDDDGDGDGTDDRRACPPLWVSCCGCTTPSTHAGPSGRSAVGNDRCSDTAACPRGWLRRIDQRDALRIAAWHWACVVAENVHEYGMYGPPERPCFAFCEDHWEKVTGTAARWHFERAHGASGADRDAGGVFFHDGYKGRLTVFSIAGRDALAMRRQFASARDSRFAVHPTWPRVRVRVDYGDGVPVCLTAFVAGDPLFVCHKDV
ncbi:hypothetical protein pkur_cds_315 [Pandoravirus kuranda]|uniref:Uncharacterized protein n=1 Tax=Pandoravirus kuranda TaxID=3019033 RepID=A0AA95J6K0_9VIRU|nr:hypothetical protein pkur_cds_315 [Pandoravirus kuranda]